MKKKCFVRDGKLLYGDPASVPVGQRVIAVHPAHREMYERVFGVKIPEPKPMTDAEREEAIKAFVDFIDTPSKPGASP